MDQMMQAIYEANPEAFDGSISRMRAGSMLRIPSKTEIRATSPAPARSELARERRAGRASPPPVVTEEPAAVAPPPPPAAAQPPAAPQGELKLSPAEEKAGAGTESPAAGTEIPPVLDGEAAAGPAPAAEAAPAKATAPIEIRDNSTRALELLAAHAREQSARQAATEQLTAEAAPAAPSPPAAATPPPQPPSVAPQPVPETSAPAPGPFVDEAAPPGTGTPAPEATPPATGQPPTSVDVTAGDKKPQPVERVDEALPVAAGDTGGFNPLILAGLGAAAVLLLAMAAVRLRKYRAAKPTVQIAPIVLSQAGDLAEPPFTKTREAAVQPHAGLAAAAARSAPEPQAARTVETTLRATLPPEQTTRQFMAVSTPEPAPAMPTIEQGTGPAASDPYADILGEADIHIAYGLYDEAARLLQEPLAKSPERKDLHLKLLEVYFSANMAKDFEAQARKMRDVVSGTSDADWEKACIMGRQLCPESTLFAGDGGAGAASLGSTADLDFSSMMGSTAQQPPPAAQATPAATTAAAALDLDLSGFSLGAGADAATPAPAKPVETAKPVPVAEAGNTLDFDLGEFKLDTPAAPSPAPAQSVPAKDDSALEIDLTDFDIGTPDAAVSPAPVADKGSDVTIDELLTPELEAGEGQADTRLDLARAYMDMGEPAMAQSLLQEVITQGNASQKQEAKELLARLGPV
jgi:pilus assembly protein FimV